MSAALIDRTVKLSVTFAKFNIMFYMVLANRSSGFVKFDF